MPSSNGHKRAAIYARRSKVEKSDNYSIENQVRACQAYAAERGMAVAEEHVYVDRVSGAVPIGEREGGALLVRAVNARHVDAVIAWTLDRVGRDPVDFLTLRRDWLKRGVELHYTDLGQAADSAESDLLDGIRAIFAGNERREIRKRTHGGRLAKAQRGQWVGAGYEPYGYQRFGVNRETRLEIDPEEAEIVRQIFAWYTEGGVALNEIVRRLDNRCVPLPRNGLGWRSTTVRFILMNERYIGRFHYGKGDERVLIELPHLAIVDRRTFDRAQEVIAENKRLSRRNRKRQYLLANFVKCSCGCTMGGRLNARGKYEYYGCSSVYSQHPAVNCNEPSIRADLLEPDFYNWLKGILDDEELWMAKLRSAATDDQNRADTRQRRLAELEGKIRDARRRVTTLTIEFGEDKDEDVRASIGVAKAQRDALIAERDVLTTEAANTGSVDVESTRRRVLEIRERFTGAGYEQLRQILAALKVKVQFQRVNGERRILYRCVLGEGESAIEFMSSGWKTLNSRASPKCRQASSRG